MTHTMLARSIRILVAVVIVAGCSDPTVPANELAIQAARVTSTGPTVKSALPSNAPQNVTLDVTISGSGFEPGSAAKWLLNGVEDARVKTNATTFISSTSLVANITIAEDAVPSLYDIAVITPQAKKGIGTEKFTVLPMVELAAPDSTSRANDINSSGYIVGNRAGGCNAGVLPVLWPNEEMWIDLPIPAGFCAAAAVKIADNGAVLGYVRTASATSYYHIVLWTPTESGYVSQVLREFPNPVEIDDMNAVGHFVGSYLNNGYRDSFWWSVETGFVDLTEPAGMQSCYVSGVNDHDEISGSCHGGPLNATYWASPYSTPEILPRLSGTTAGYLGHAINNLGVIVGYGSIGTQKGQTVNTTLRWSKGAAGWNLEDLGSIGGQPIPNVVNDLGWIAGSDVPKGGTRHAVLWRPDRGMQDLGVTGVESYAWGMNNPASANAIRVVGMSNRKGNWRAVVWTPQ
jgi:hypothetical protein